MENLEKIKQPEIKIQELLSLIESIKWENEYEFSYNGTNFLLFIITKEDIETFDAGESAEYHRSTLIDGYDIYLHDTIPEADRKRVLFHEILEANLQDQGFANDAHRITLKEEQKIFNEREK